MINIYDMLNLLPIQTLTPFLIIGTIVEILISGLIFKISLKIVGGQIKLSRAIIFTIIIKSVNLAISLFAPPFFYNFYVFVLSHALWILLVMKIYKLSFGKAVIVAIIQFIITFVFSLIGVSLFIQNLKLGVAT